MSTHGKQDGGDVPRDVSRSEFLERIRPMAGDNLQKLINAEVVSRWLTDNEWVNDPAIPCRHCEHLYLVTDGKFSKEDCAEKTQAGLPCYRETLRTLFMPLLQRILRGDYPSNEELTRKVHHDDSGLFEVSTALGIIQHELGGTYMKMETEAEQTE